MSLPNIAQMSVEELLQLNPALAALIAQKDNAIKHRDLKIAQLTHEMATLKRWTFGKRSEQISALQKSLLDEAIGEGGGQPHRCQCRPGCEREDGRTRQARAHGATPGEHAAESHADGANHGAAHCRCSLKPFEAQLPEHGCREEGAQEHPGHQTHVEAGRLVAGEEHAREDFS